MSESRVLFDVLIRPGDETRVIEAVTAASGESAPRFEFVDAVADEPSHEALAEQWKVEHPNEPLNDRRVRHLAADVTEADARKVAESVLDVICPHAREEGARIERGERFPVTPDEFPWFAYVSVASGDVVPADSPTVGISATRVSIVRWHWDGYPGWVEVEVTDADGRTHRISEKVPVLTALDLYPDTPVSDLPTELWIDADLVQAADERVTISLRHGVETVEGLSVLTLPPAAVRHI
ncbi:hypothetical protein LB823_13405 [Tsukamurella sp. M9C]|uniref:hypothetical protein n=1 Tax=Tsukamurella sp. M9C TaxID=2877520 RepID=UPI001CCCA192|nr:hypothetical protein [Tsukamurella sp. M9C]MCA0157191.1 hypothetical protein [Tsukamurella sp. M9C]